jgi:hypothetical protein
LNAPLRAALYHTRSSSACSTLNWRHPRHLQTATVGAMLCIIVTDHYLPIHVPAMALWAVMRFKESVMIHLLMHRGGGRIFLHAVVTLFVTQSVPGLVAGA